MAYPRFMHGAVMVHIVWKAVEILDRLDDINHIYGMKFKKYHHMYCLDTGFLTFESVGSEFESLRGR